MAGRFGEVVIGGETSSEPTEDSSSQEVVMMSRILQQLRMKKWAWMTMGVKVKKEKEGRPRSCHLISLRPSGVWKLFSPVPAVFGRCDKVVLRDILLAFSVWRKKDPLRAKAVA